MGRNRLVLCYLAVLLLLGGGVRMQLHHCACMQPLGTCTGPPPSPIRPCLPSSWALAQLGEMWGGPKSEDTEFVRVRAMLKSLGLPVSAVWRWRLSGAPAGCA